MIKKLKSLSDVLPQLLLGILLFGVICQIVGAFLVKEKLFYSIGLWFGITCAMAMAVHMAWSLNRAMDLSEDGAVKKMQQSNLLRYGVVVLLFGILLLTKIGNPLAAFLGVMGLKVAAYLVPITDKLFRR